VTGTDGVRGALADALATAGSRQPSSMAGPVADALAELLAEHLRLTTVALGNVLDATDPNSRALAVHHRGVAEKAINRLWEARRELLPDPDAASTPVEKGEHPQVSAYVQGVTDRDTAGANAAALGLDGPIVHQIETRPAPLGVSGAEAMANWAANAAVLKAAGEPTLFGQPVGDGLDDERADAKTAISILRLLLRSGARLATLHGAIPGQVVLRPADAVIVDGEQADLLNRLDRPVTGPLPHGGTSDAD
jgi:hypothetical protein